MRCIAVFSVVVAAVLSSAVAVVKCFDHKVYQGCCCQCLLLAVLDVLVLAVALVVLDAYDDVLSLLLLLTAMCSKIVLGKMFGILPELWGS